MQPDALIRIIEKQLVDTWKARYRLIRDTPGFAGEQAKHDGAIMALSMLRKQLDNKPESAQGDLL